MGAYVYASHDSTDIMCAAYAFDDEPVELWTPDMPCPTRIADHILSGGEIAAHNAAFERLIMRHVAVPRYGWPEPRLEQYRCTAAEAAAMSLPRSLDALAKALGTRKKDEEGHNLMMRVSRPRKVNDDGTYVWWTDRDRLERLYAYCKQDIEAERAAEKCLRRLDPAEREVYLLDQRINDRGVRVDRELVVAARELADEGIRRANGHLSDLTDSAVTTVTNHGKLLKWLRDNGVDTDSVDKPAVAAMLEDDGLSEKVRRVLQLRSDAGRSSIAKLDTMLAFASDADDRARGMLLYHGASTGRWSGRGPQPQNFPRGSVADVESFIPLVLERAYDAINCVEHPLTVVSSLLRAMLCAAPGCELIAADYSAIEARVLNWLAGQDDITALFANGTDVYKHNAARLYKVDYADVTKTQRQTGKFQELGCGFGMGAKKAVAAGKATYGLELTDDEAKAIVDGYRLTHNRVVDFWYETERACIEAINTPGVPVLFGGHKNLRVFVAGKYMYLVLPSKRPLVYPAPRVVQAPTPWGDMKDTVEVSGVDTFSRQWGRIRLYGGLIVENITQATARDIMAEGMLALEKAGYPPILSVHDEVISEVPAGFGSVAEFEKILAEPPAWATGCPISAEGWRGSRYRK